LITSGVIPGRAESASPESMDTDRAKICRPVFMLGWTAPDGIGVPE
jgi:hypothetical protein